VERTAAWGGAACKTAQGCAKMKNSVGKVNPGFRRKKVKTVKRSRPWRSGKKSFGRNGTKERIKKGGSAIGENRMKTSGEPVLQGGHVKHQGEKTSSSNWCSAKETRKKIKPTGKKHALKLNLVAQRGGI